MIDTALWLKKERTLIINDLHLGYEEALHQKGILVPKFQIQEIMQKLEHILQKVMPQKMIINGDLKHEFGKVLRQEWKEVLQFLDFISSKIPEIIIIRGNHDPILPAIVKHRNIRVVKEYQINNLLIVHGDELVTTNAKTIIIGHEHPAITLRHKSKHEKYKCFLVGKWQGKELIAVPSFNPLLEGTDILKETVLSPFLENIRNFKVYVVGKEEVFEFGKVRTIKTLA